MERLDPIKRKQVGKAKQHICDRKWASIHERITPKLEKAHADALAELGSGRAKTTFTSSKTSTKGIGYFLSAWTW